MKILKRNELTAVLSGVTVTVNGIGGECRPMDYGKEPFSFAAAYIAFVDAADNNSLHMGDSTVNVSVDPKDSRAIISYNCDEYGDSAPEGAFHVEAVFDVTVTATGERAAEDKISALLGPLEQDTPVECANCKWDLCYDNGDGTFECLGCGKTLTAAQIGLDTSNGKE